MVSKEFNHPVSDCVEIVQLKSEVHEGLSGYLDPSGPISIGLASEHEECLFLIDEIRGRSAAKEMGIPVTGSLGVLIPAKNKGHLEAVKSILETIQKTNFRISKELIKRVLEKLNET